MELGDALYREIAGKSPRTEVADFDDALDYLVAAYGSASAAARAIGEPPSTVRHWATGKRAPKGDRADRVLNLVKRLERRARLPKGRERKLRAPGSLGDAIKCTIEVSDPEDRTLDVRQYLGDGIEDALVDAFLDGATPDELADVFHEYVEGSAFYEDLFEPGGGQYETDIEDLGWR